jgi:hydrogenase maturation factor
VDVDFDAIELPEDIAALARVLDFDPWQAISEGTLLAAVEPKAVDRVRSEWRKAGIESMILGRFDADLKENTLVRDTTRQVLKEPDKDPFWELFFAGLEK